MRSLLCHALLPILLSGLAAEAIAQAPPATPAPNPTERNAPAEIMPPKPASAPAPDQKAVETTTPPAAISPGSKDAAALESAAGKNPVDALSPAELDQVLAAIRDRYIAAAKLNDAELKRATVQGLLDRLGSGVTIAPAAAADAATASPFRTEVLENRIVYARLGGIDQASVASLDAALKTAAETAGGAVVLDLRATPRGTNLEAAAEVCRRFSPKGKVLFSLRRPGAKEQIFTSKDEPRFRGLLAVLVDSDAAGSAEVIAAVLRAHAGAMVIGGKTKGEAAEFSEVPLGSGHVLRIAVAEVALPDGSAISLEGVKPDLAVEVPAETTAMLLAQELEKGVAPFIYETERPRMNEAALVAGTNPELDALQAAQRNRGERPKPPLRDAALQRALDFITTIAVYEKAPRGRK
jgi:hypothetical protein